MLNEININIKDEKKLFNTAKALSSLNRIKILSVLNSKSYNISELSKELNIPISTIRFDLEMLKNADLIKLTTTYTQSGKSVIVYRLTDNVNIDLTLWGTSSKNFKEYEYILPIGSFSSTENVKFPCGMASETGFLCNDNDESVFYSPNRFKAELIWFTSGFLEYKVKLPELTQPIKELEISFEACSEAPLYNNDYKSDISLIINEKEIGPYCCPGDFGGMRGQLNPSFWPDNMTQYGILTHWCVSEINTTMNNAFMSFIKISDIDFTKQKYLSIKIGVKENAEHCGGINLFGSKFGNHPQHIMVKIKT